MALLVYQVLFLAIIQNVFMKSNFSRNGYHLVPSCPKNKTEWEARSLKLKCNNTSQYHCNHFNTSQLYEFCYKREPIKVDKEHCLGIVENGILNRDTCKFFVRGCPTEDYYSNESYKYPSCLSIHDNCYTEDCVCNCLSAKKLNLTATQTKDTCTCRGNSITGPCENHSPYLPGFVVFVVLFAISIISNVGFVYHWYLLKQNEHRGETSIITDEEERLVSDAIGGEQPKISCAIGGETSTIAVKEERLVPDAIEEDQNHVSYRQQENKVEPDDIYRMTLVDFTIEDEQLFKLLKRQCLHGVPSEFKYLVKTRVQPANCKKGYIFEQRDENGCILLHYAAQGGNIIILDEILRITSNKILENKCIRGQSALHFAIKHKQKDMTEHLIELYSAISQDTDSTATEINEENKCKPVQGEFSPVHLAAWFGDTRLLDNLMEIGFDILAKTRNGLNILDIACMKNVLEESDVEFQFCKYLLNDKLENIVPRKTDISGWNIAHYASLSNFKLFECISSNKDICDLAMMKTKASKTCLHIACEFGKTEIVDFIANDPQLKELIPCTDSLGWNALHFAAKGGKLKILEDLLKINCMEISCKTNDGKTLLHIACIHKHKCICKFLLKSEEFSKNEDLLNAKTTNNNLTAAHYLAVEKKEDGSEKDIFEMLIESGMNLLTKNKRGLTVLEFAIDHLNKDLIECIVGAICKGKLDITVEILSECKKDPKNESIQNILQKGIDELNLRQSDPV